LRGIAASRGQDRNFDEHLQTSADAVACREADPWSDLSMPAPGPGESGMSLLGSFRAEQLIQDLSTEKDPTCDKAQKLVQKIKKIGPKVIPKVMDALAMSDKSHTMVYVDILSALVSDKNIDSYREGLADGNERVVKGTAWALSSSTDYSINKLLDWFDDEEVSKHALIEVLQVHKDDLSVHELLQKAYELDVKEQAALFRIIDSMIREEMVPDLIARMGGRDPVIKVHLIQVLQKYKGHSIDKAFEAELKDPNKMVRSAALSALASRGAGVNIAAVAKLLQDPDLDVQNKAVDMLVQLNHPETVKYLTEALKDESEYSRRAAVEVLNEIGSTNSVKQLFEAIKDDDWWVRSRAGDALAEIGGPKVVDSVVSLITDDDEEIRRTAIEILNATKDERAVDHLIAATDDSDWWVRERAIDALSQIGNPKALPKLESMLGKDPKTDTVIVRALAKIGNKTHIAKIVPLLKTPNRELQIEAMKALSKLADETQAETIRAVLERVRQIDEPKTMLLEDDELEQLLEAQKAASAQASLDTTTVIEGQPPAPPPPARLDISKLKPGDVIDGRYKYIEKIGKGAFGTVLLMQDEVVDERLILKFLNPNVSSDEEMMKRFVHELRYSRKITHRNVIRIYDFLNLEGSYAISMEYFPSHTLSGEIPDNKPMDISKALAFSRDIATGMAVAHQAGVIHRDLKPANLLVNDEGLLKIVDFGVAAAASSGDTQLTKTGYVIGSPKYMAPEQILGKKVDETADIYSVGVIMYEMVTGIPPYSRGDHMSVMYQHVQGKAKACQEINPSIPDAFAAVIAKAMSVDKSKRYQSMIELTEALDALSAAA
jgi:serine/threonine-protein kinase